MVLENKTLRLWLGESLNDYSMERERSFEESDTLERSTKKFKENHCIKEHDHGNYGIEANAFRSYKDKLVGDIPSAYEQAFGFEIGRASCRERV